MDNFFSWQTPPSSAQELPPPQPAATTTTKTIKSEIVRDMSLGFGDVQEEALSFRQRNSTDLLYQELMSGSGLLTVGGKTQRVAVEDLQFIAELGHGSCGHVSKMQYNDNVMAVKSKSENPLCTSAAINIGGAKELGRLFIFAHSLTILHEAMTRDYLLTAMPRSTNPVENNRIIMDLRILSRAYDCPHIVHSFGYIITENEVMICMEAMATCLDLLLKRTGNAPIPEPIVGKMSVSVVRALHYLKENHVPSKAFDG
ncbi:hypothetical protein ANCDUO_00777 [Ancylostoma duodenale]|uniref:Protein kinase domain-containing protein n=1 Tax=Ancylostoma duodenale TaxID=51022 RepID=A0A0C2E0Q1_9BILA|nr:hypothetical protein ANCDUO_00777 [Ancylostoma duodenale]